MAKKDQINRREESGGHVALLLPELRIGGAQRVFLTLAKDFVERGMKVDLIVLANEGELLVELPQGVQLVPMANQPFSTGVMFLLKVLFKLIYYLKKNRPDALLSTLTGTNILAVIAHSFSNVNTRLVLREAASLANIRRSYLFFLMRYLYKKADSLIVLTEFMKKEMEEKLKLPSHKIHQISNPIDLMAIGRAAKEPLPKDFDDTSPYAVAIGRLAPQKDYLTLFNAFAEVSKTISLRLVILGEGPDRPLLEERIRVLCLCDKIELRGFDPNPYRWIASASLFVMSSRWEGYPNVLLEAIALGKPIVSTIYDTSIYKVLSNQNECLVPVGDVSGLANAICRTSTNSFPHSNEPYLPTGVIDASSCYIKAMGC